jgi:hypothetical protein
MDGSPFTVAASGAGMIALPGLSLFQWPCDGHLLVVVSAFERTGYVDPILTLS